MTLPATAPIWVSGLRDRFLESTTVTTTLGASASSFWYPRVPSSTTLPAFVLERSTFEAERASNGGVYSSGTCVAVLYLDGSAAGGFDDGQTESMADAIAQELTALQTDGLWIKRIVVGRCSDPSPGMQGAKETGQPESGPAIRSILFTVEWGDG